MLQIPIWCILSLAFSLSLSTKVLISIEVSTEFYSKIRLERMWLWLWVCYLLFIFSLFLLGTFLSLLFFHNRGNCFESGKRLNGLCIFGKMLVVLLCCAHLALILMQETWRWSSSWIEFVCVCVPCFERDDWVPALSLTPHNSGTEKHANLLFIHIYKSPE